MEPSRASSSSQACTISQLRDLVLSGRLRVPQFQRSFRWEASDVQSLVDSVLRGYPIGSLLFWEREAPEEEIVVGALRVHALARPDAMWVVDGQQRLTSLVNVTDPAGFKDPRFAVGYSLRSGEVVRGARLDDPLVIPLSDLFDFSRTLAWLGRNPDGAAFATQVQDVARRLNLADLPVTIMKDADERTLREVFDRINSRGKRLSAAEIFDAIHGGVSERTSMTGIAQRVDAQTQFGVLNEHTVVQALLIRRNTDITRDLHGEFSLTRRRASDLPEESESEAYAATEAALTSAVRFLRGCCGIPHMTFLPFRFQLLVLCRFFAFFPEPSDRNQELLSRWLWRTSVGADQLGLSGSQADLRSLASCVIPGQESASVQRLLEGARLTAAPEAPDLSVFRTTRSDSKLILAALWSLEPFNPLTSAPITQETLAETLVGETTPRAMVTDLVTPRNAPEGCALAALKVISVVEGRELVAALEAGTDLHSLLLDAAMVRALQRDDVPEFLKLREVAMRSFLHDFLIVRTGWEQDDSPPLSDYVFDGLEMEEP
ncbi:DUF262 domain-containing protein [Actinomyces trachealis]|uniref:DUF262 domain-containing protein n=1 Tax=Actinomyces trachealis TaxID=2763540 RepID=UPI0018C7E20F|nr:DUF262 domain-containing protein [Actinomyces trachealis]